MSFNQNRYYQFVGLCLLGGLLLVAWLTQTQASEPVVERHQTVQVTGQTVVEKDATSRPAPPTKTPPAPNWRGQVLDRISGQSLDATIEISNTSTTTAQTAEAGTFQITGRQPPFALRVTAPGYDPWQRTINAQTPRFLTINLDPRATAGHVSAADSGRPLANLVLAVTSAQRQETITTTVDGSFQLLRLQPGEQVTFEPQTGYLSTTVTFEGQPSLDLALRPRVLTVTVRDSLTGRPVPGARLKNDSRITGATNLTGQERLERVSATNTITIAAAGYQTRTIVTNNVLTAATRLLPMRLTGTVRDRETGQPLPQAMIYLGDAYFRADDAGQFVIEPVPNRPVSLTIKAAGYHRTYARLAQTGVYTSYDPPFAGAEGRWLQPAACRRPAFGSCLMFDLEPFHARAIYIPLRYMSSRERMIGYLDMIAGTDHNALVVDVKGDFGQLVWDSDLDLAAEIGAEAWVKPHWVSLEEFVAEARARNIYTIARLVVFKDDPLAHAKPEWATVTADGQVWIDGEELGWANPFKEEVWDYNIALAKEVAAAGFDELNFDYIRFPSDGNIDAIAYEEENTRKTRTAAIGQFMSRLAQALHPTGVFLSGDVFGLTIWVEPESDMSIGQRIIDIAPHLDYLAPMVYPSTFIPGNLGYDNPAARPYDVVSRSQIKAETLVPPYVRVRPWLQAYWYSLDEMQQLKQAALDTNATGWAWWNAGGKYDEELFK